MKYFRSHSLTKIFILAILFLSGTLFSAIQAESNPSMKTFARDSERETKVKYDQIELTVPPGATEEMTIVRDDSDLTGIEIPFGVKILNSYRYRFGPEGLSFSESKKLKFRLKWNPTEYPGGLPSGMELYYINRNSGKLESFGGNINPTSGDFEAKIPHFSQWVIGIKNDWGSSLNPYCDYISNGPEHVSVPSLSLTMNIPVYSIPLRGGTQINFTRIYEKDPSDNPFSISDHWSWDFPSYYTLSTNYGNSRLIYKGGSITRYDSGGSVYEIHWTTEAPNSPPLNTGGYPNPGIDTIHLKDGTRIEPREGYETVYDPNGNWYRYNFSKFPGKDHYGNFHEYLRISSLEDCLGRKFEFKYEMKDIGVYYFNATPAPCPRPYLTELRQIAGVNGIPMAMTTPILRRSFQTFSLERFTDALNRATTYNNVYYYCGFTTSSGLPALVCDITGITYPNGVRSEYQYAYIESQVRSKVSYQRFYQPGEPAPFRTVSYSGNDQGWGYNGFRWLPMVVVNEGRVTRKYYLDEFGNTDHEETYDCATQKLLKKIIYCNQAIYVIDSNGNSAPEKTSRPVAVYTQLMNPDGGLAAALSTATQYDNWGNVIFFKDPYGTETRTLYNNTSSMSQNLAAYGMQNPSFITNGMFFNKPATQAVIVTDPVHQTQELRQTHYEYDSKGNLLTERVVLQDLAPSETGGVMYLNTSYSYNGFGSLSTKTDPNNNVIRYGYSPEYNYAYVTAVYSGYKLLASYEYNPDTGLKKSATDPKGNVFSYTYDLSGRLLTESLDDPDDPDRWNVAITKEIIYSDWANQVTIKYGNTTRGFQEGRITYDLFFGKPTLIERRLNGAYVVVKKAGYNSNGELDWEEENLGRRTIHSYDALGREIATTLPGGQVIRNEYIQWATLRSVTTTDPNGNTKKQYFDFLDRLVKVEEHPDSRTTYTTQYTYDTAGQLIRTTNDRGVLSTNTYDNLGRLIQVDYPQDGSNPMVPEAYQYDLAGNLWKKTSAQGTKVMEYEFNGGYRLQKVTEADGRVVNYIYDANDNLVTQSVTDKNQSTPSVKYTYSNYDARNRAHNFTATLDGRSFTFGYDYDTYGRVTGVTYPNRAEKVTYTYDDLDRLLSIPGFVNSCGYGGDNKLISMTFGNGVNTKYSYDINGRLAVMGADQQVGTGVEAEEMTLGNYTIAPNESASNGSLLQCPAGQGTASYQYTGASGSYALKVIYYDESDGASTFKIRLNGVTIDQWTADRNMGPGTEEATSRNRLSRVKEAVALNPGDTITLEGTASGGENARVDRLKIIPQSQYLYNLDYEYDPNGNITRIGEDYYKYDGLNRLVWAGNTKAAPMISASPNPCIIPSGQTTGSVTITCNPPTHQFEVRVSVDGGPETLLTGGFNAVANWIQAGKTYVFTLYDCSGVSQKTPDEILEDNLGNVIPPTVGVKLDSVTVTARRGYMSANPNPCIIPPGQSTASVTINTSPPVSQFQVWVSINGGAELLMSGSKTSFVHWIAANKTYTFSLYDYTGGVKGAKLDSITVAGMSYTGEELGRKGTAWEYDCSGNMTRIEQYIGGQIHDFQDLEYDLANRLWKKCRVTYENDANGNRISRTLDGKTFGYLYDGENRLTQVTKNGVDVLDNVYDGAGMRIKEVKGGQTTYFVYQGNNPLMEYTPGDGRYKYFIYAGNKMVAEEMDGIVKYYYGDHLGSTRVVSDAAGNKVAEYKLRPYGEKDSSSGTFSTDYQFTGKPSIDEVGLSYFGARFYDPEVGRFISVDPVKDGLNWYLYCSDNPINKFDPDGRADFWATFRTVCGYIVPGYSAACSAYDSFQNGDYINGTIYGISSFLDPAVMFFGGAAVKAATGTSAALTAATQTNTAASEVGSKVFQAGKLFESWTTSKNGIKIGALAETHINGSTLTLNNLTVYANGSGTANAVGTKEFLTWLNQVKEMAIKDGFTTLVINGERVLGSTSANPGKAVNIVIDLTKI